MKDRPTWKSHGFIFGVITTSYAVPILRRSLFFGMCDNSLLEKLLSVGLCPSGFCDFAGDGDGVLFFEYTN